jgi:hypothetical protein
MGFSEQWYELAKDIQNIDKKIKLKFIDLLLNLIKY